MSAMKRILELMVEKHASDVYLSANAVALIKINGTSVSFNNQVLGATTPLNLLSEIVTSAQIEELKETGELNMSIQMPDLGNFRISAMRQRGSYAVVIRYIPLAIPPFDTLHLPDATDPFGDGQTRFGADGGFHRLGQKHHAGVHAGLPQRAHHRPYFDGGRPG